VFRRCFNALRAPPRDAQTARFRSCRIARVTAAPPALSPFSFLRTAVPMLLPTPPYRFPGARVLYQPKWVRAEAARRVTPDGVHLLSAFGWTLGGVFVVDWTDSPIGPYSEAAVLSGLVWRDGALGAWASHIVVTSPDAVAAARQFWGLPAVEGVVSLQPGSAPGRRAQPTRGAAGEGSAASEAADEAVAKGAAVGADTDAPLIFDFESSVRVLVRGWEKGPAPSPAPQPEGSQLFRLSLPSLSGGLPPNGPILRYPLTLTAPRCIRLRAAAATVWTEGITPAALVGVLEGPPTALCLQLEGVDVVAGAAVVLTRKHAARGRDTAGGGGTVRGSGIAAGSDTAGGDDTARGGNTGGGSGGRRRPAAKAVATGGGGGGRASGRQRGGEGASNVVASAAGGERPPDPSLQISPLLLALDSGMLILYGLVCAIIGLYTSGEALLPSAPDAVRDAREIAFTLDTCAAHALSWGLGATATGAAASDWISLPLSEHRAAIGGVARVLPAWLLSVPLFEFLRALAAVAVGAHDLAADDWPALAGVTYPGGSVGTLGLMLVWRRWLVDTTPR
jgi:hypothetical protein